MDISSVTSYGRTLRRPRGILFDLGDTLLEMERFDPVAGTARVLELAKNPKGLRVEEIRELADELSAALASRREASMLEFPPHMVHRLVYEPHGITFGLSCEEVELEFWKVATRFAPEPEIEEVLDALRGLAVPMGIASNSAFSGRALSWELAHNGLSEYFEFLMSSADYGVRKPDPIFLRAGASKLGFEPSDLWYVGNSIRYDVAGALNAGMGAIWYNRIKAPGDDGTKPDAEVHGWREFLDLVREFC